MAEVFRDHDYAWECAKNTRGWAMRCEERNRELLAECGRLREQAEQWERRCEQAYERFDAASNDAMQANLKLGRLREQLDAARKALQHYADQDTWDLDQLSYDESNTAGYVFWHYDGHRAEEPWAVARAALGVGDE